MSAWFLYHREVPIHRDAVSTLFTDKGYRECVTRNFGPWSLLAWPAQISEDPILAEDDEGNLVVMAGAFGYRGLGGMDALKALLSDATRDALAHEECAGCYSALLWLRERLVVFTDRSGLSPLFHDDSGRVLSTSLLAMLEAGPEPRTLHREAVVEQMLTGVVTGRDTVASGVRQCSAACPPEGRTDLWEFHVGPDPLLAPLQSYRSFSDAVRDQVEGMKDAFARIRGMVGNRVAGLGLSGGYDSRLLLLLARDAGVTLRGHSYGSSSHSLENAIAEQLAQAAGLAFSRVPVELADRMAPERLEHNIRDGLLFFDGRTNLTMGSFNDVHTRHVRRQCLDGCGFAFNGLGGELYRNREHYPDRRFSFDDWFAYFVMTPRNALSLRGEGRDLIEAVKDKHLALIGLADRSRFGRSWARLHYRNIWLPYHAGPKHAAESTLTGHLIPFADATLSARALAIDSVLGVSGAFEAAMITALDPRIAALPSTYGHDFTRIPRTLTLRHVLTSLVPPGRRQWIAARRIRKGSSDGRAKDFIATHSSLTEAWTFLRDLRLPVDLDLLVRDRADAERVLYIAVFLHHFRHRFRI